MKIWIVSSGSSEDASENSLQEESMYRKWIKRLLDIIISGAGLLILSPLLLILWILVRCKLGSPVLFTQERPGRKEKIFKLYKFRTMTDARDEKGELLPDEVRLTRDMSLIGPRPLLVRYLPYYTKEERRRHDVRPGLTGLAQVNGRNALGWEARFAYDIEYVDHLTFLMDLKIIGMTVYKVLKRSDTLSGDQQTVEDFDKYRSKGQAG